MKHIKFIIFLLIITVSFTYGQAPKSFSEKPADFVKELEGYLKKTNRKDCEAAIKEFKKNYAAFDEENMTQIIKNGNDMLTRRLTAFPYFYNYVSTLNNLVDKKLDAAELKNWLNIMNQVLISQKKGNNKNFKAYIEFSNSFYGDNLLYSSSSKSWGYVSDSYKLVYEKEPKLIFTKLDLVGYAKKDTIYIRNTSGTFLPLTKMWSGKAGEMNWERAGLSGDDIFATFKGKYEFELKDNKFAIDSVGFIHKPFITEPAIGRYEDKLISNNKSKTSTYPRFYSYENVLKIDNLAENVKYVGGFQLIGSKIVGTGTSDKKAQVFFFNNDKLAMQANSVEFKLKRGKELVSQDAETIIYVDKDSIYHPSLTIKFDLATNKVNLKRDSKGLGKVPFYSSIHKMQMDVDQFDWDLEKGEMEMKMTSTTGQTPAIFTSEAYFKLSDYVKLEANTDYNPVSELKIYFEETGSMEIYAENFAKRLDPKFSVSMIRGLLYQLMEEGFIFYNKDKEDIKIQQKSIDYVFASQEMIDYDNIKIRSRSKKANGKYQIEDKSMSLNGVKNVTVSDSQSVSFFPRKDSIDILENRDMLFDGTLLAGGGEFFGEQFKFSYENFDVDMGDVKEFVLKTPEPTDKPDVFKYVPIHSLIEGLKGKVTIDEPNNKSGKENYGEYPSFESTSNSRVFYDKKMKGVYERETFFFELEPFKIDSLDTYNPYALKFKGKLVSDKIFPDFEEQLILRQNDKALGFRTFTPETGYKTYGISTFYEEIDLSSKGVVGRGKLDYLSAQFVSDSLHFFPDSARGICQNFTMEGKNLNGVEFPDITAENSKILWKPYKDSLFINSEKDRFYFFQETADLKGSLVLQSKGLKGEGILDWAEASIQSKDINFMMTSFQTDTGRLRIKALDSTVVAFDNKSVNAFVDFKEKVGKFKSNQPDEYLDLPYSKYKTLMNDFEWEMRDGKIILKNSKERVRSPFFSTKKGQDNLTFDGKEAVYDLATNLLTIKGVEYIKSADAKIYPFDEQVEIEGEAAMKTFKNARIIADTITNYHTIDSAEVTILGRKEYKAKGNYTYNVAGKEQSIYFDNIRTESLTKKSGKKGENVKEEIITVAAGSVKGEEDFIIDKKISYKGEVGLKGNSKLLNFDGFARLNISKMETPEWFSIKQAVDPKNLVISYEELKNPDGYKVNSGIYTNTFDSTYTYPCVFCIKNAPKDSVVFDAKGVVYYKPNTDQFVMGDSLKVFGKSTRGNVMKYNDNTGNVELDGRFNFGLNTEPAAIIAAGTGKTNFDGKPLNMNLAVGFDFIFPAELMTKLSSDLYQGAFDETDIDYDNYPMFKQQLPQFISNDKVVDKTIESMEALSAFTMPKAMPYELFFSQLNMIWNQESESFVSKGKLGLAATGERSINKSYKGYIEYGVRYKKKFFNIYIETTADEWFFFTYANGSLFTVSSNTTYNDMIMGMKDKDRITKLSKTKVYQVALSTISKKENFIYRMDELK